MCDGPELYHSVNGALMSASLGRVTGVAGDALAKFAAERLVRSKRGSIPAQPTYKEALVAWGLSKRTLSYAEYDDLVFGEPDWWVQKRMLRQLDQNLFGMATYADLINRLLRGKSGEVSRMAASRLLQESAQTGDTLWRCGGHREAHAQSGWRHQKCGSACEPHQSDTFPTLCERAESAYGWKRFFRGLS